MATSISCPSSATSSSIIRSPSFRAPISKYFSKTKTHILKFQPLPHSTSFDSKISFLPKKRHCQTRLDIKTNALAGFDVASAQPLLESIGVLTTIVVVHESGHFLAAYLQGIRVSKFAIGFGPILAKLNSNNVEYSIRAFPLGGFVGFPDNEPNSDIPADDENLLRNRPALDRVIVISAGVVANVVFAYLIILVQVLSVGLPVQELFPGVIVPEVRALSAGERDGLMVGDVIFAVNGYELPESGQNLVTGIVDIIKKNPKRNVVLKVGRGKDSLDIDVTPDETLDGTGRIGVQLSPNVKISKVKPKNVVDTFNYVNREFWGLTFSVVNGLKQTFGNFSQQAGKVSGPVAIIAVGAQVAKSNVDGLYQFAALLNLNLAVINLLPLPALDGGSLALILLEAARGGKKLPTEIEQGFMSSGVLLVTFLGVYLLVRDSLNLDFIRQIL